MFSCQNETDKFVSRKAYEISYALFRISSYIKKQSFADRLESQAIMFLEAAVAGDYARTALSSTTIEYLIQIGSDLGIVHPANAQMVGNEIKGFNSAISELSNAAKPAVDLGGVFSRLPTVTKEEEVISSPPNFFVSGNAPEREEGGSLENGNGHSIAKAAIRQTLIIEKIRQNGNLHDGKAGCRLKEIQEVLPEVSERTIRYDIQRLLERGSIERIGNGGPATYYKVNV